MRVNLSVIVAIAVVTYWIYGVYAYLNWKHRGMAHRGYVESSSTAWSNFGNCITFTAVVLTAAVVLYNVIWEYGETLHRNKIEIAEIAEDTKYIYLEDSNGDTYKKDKKSISVRYTLEENEAWLYDEIAVWGILEGGKIECIELPKELNPDKATTVWEKN